MESSSVEPQTANDEAARSTEILREANEFLEQVKLKYQSKPEVYKELFRLLTSYAAARDEAHRQIHSKVEALFGGLAAEFPKLRGVLIRTIRFARDTPYAAALVNSAINRATKVTIGSTAAEDSTEEMIEDGAMNFTKFMIENSPGFGVDADLFGGFVQLLPGNGSPPVVGRTMATGGTSRFHKEEGKQYMERAHFSDRPDVYEGYNTAIADFEKTRIRANRRLYVKARILLQDSPQLFEGFEKFMPANGRGELYRTPAGKLRWRHYNDEHSAFEN
ncbi:hypothetical protein V494_01774 [Pseudogymnoascus sp. VKM F-4513 (FW-928)]|nr:hypothetical protein V494_01774 [Pseudogymnoascus sp. VKM F-4513 (FW-928)]